MILSHQGQDTTIAPDVSRYSRNPALIEIKLYLSGAPTVEPTTQPTGWVTTQPTDSAAGRHSGRRRRVGKFPDGGSARYREGFGVGFATAKLIFGTLLSPLHRFRDRKQLTEEEPPSLVLDSAVQCWRSHRSSAWSG